MNITSLKRAYDVLTVPNPLLNQLAHRVTFPLDQDTTNDVYFLKTCLKKNYNKHKAVGLAAPQVGILKRIFIIARDLTGRSNATQSRFRKLDVYINPEIVERNPEYEESEENCLSVPLLVSPMVQRHRSVKVRYYNMSGQESVLELGGFRGMIFQHQLDHLNGITVDQRIDRLVSSV